MSQGSFAGVRLLFIVLFFAALSAGANDDAQVDKTVRAQQTTNSPAPTVVPAGQPIPASTGESLYGVARPGPPRSAPLAPTKEVIIVPLDNTGVVDFRFLNPRRPVFVPPGAGVEFKNDTSDRTFSVSIPVSIKTSDVEYTYPVLQRAVDVPRIRQNHIEEGLGLASNQQLPGDVVGLLERIDRASRVRELLKNVDLVKIRPEGLPKAMDKARTDRLQQLRDQLAAIDARLGNPPSPKGSCCPERPFSEADALLVPWCEEAAPPDSPPTRLGANARDIAVATAYAQLAKLTSELLAATTDTLRAQLRAEIKKQQDALDAALNATPAPVLLPAVQGQTERDRLRQERADVCAEIRRQERDATDVDGRQRQYMALLGTDDAKGLRLAGSRDRALEVRALILGEIDTHLKDLIDSRKSMLYNPIKDIREAANRGRRTMRTWFNESERKRSEAAAARIRLADRALAELDAQGSSDANAAISAKFAFIDVTGCSGEDKYSCSAVRIIPPGQSATFPGAFMAVATPATTLIKFQVKFFDEAQDPANSVAYLSRSEVTTPPGPEFTWNLVGSVGQKRDAIAEAAPVVPPANPPVDPPADPFPCGTFLCAEGHRNHFQGSGRLDARQRFADYFEGSGSLSFKSGDLGGADETNKISFSKYQFNVVSDIGLALHFGKFDFAKPTSGIAINESGEGFRLLWSNFSGGYIVKRESAARTSNRENRDSTSFVAQATNFTLTKSGVARSISFYATRGQDQTPTSPACTPTATTACPTPTHAYEYETFGVELSYAIPIIYVHGNIGYYTSSRNVKAEGTPCLFGEKQCDGRGSVALVTLNRSFALDAKNRPARAFTATWGRGTGDDPSTPNSDEGYIGETGGFAPDQIFLSTLVGPVNKFNSKEARFTDLNVGATRLGSGLSNKQYIGIQYVENTYSPLEQLVSVFKMKDVASYSTTFSYHNYRLRREFLGEKGAGHEFDLSFLLEAPKNVKTTIAAGYYFPGAAVTQYVDRNLWTVSSNVSVSFGQ